MLDEGMADSGPSRRFLRDLHAQVQAVHVRLQEDATAGQEQAAEQEERRPDPDTAEAGGETQGFDQGEPGDG